MFKRRRKKVSLFIVVAGLVSLWIVLPAYHFTKARRAEARAAGALAAANYAQAALSARRALQINSNSVVACRVLAELAERIRIPQAVYWRKRVVDLEPGAGSNRLALARTALLLGQLPLAAQTLTALPEEQRRTDVTYQRLASQVAFAQGRLAAAEQHLIQAAELEPTNTLHQLNLDIARLHAAESATWQAARQRLEASRHDPLHGRDILRALTREALGREDLTRARSLSLQLQTRPDATLDDRLLHLGILRRGSESVPVPASDAGAGRDFSEFLLKTERETSQSPEHSAHLARWLISHGLAQSTLPWLETLPDAIRAATCIRLAEAECHLALQNWRELGALLAEGHWGAEDHLRHAILSLVCRQQGDEQRARMEWKRAVRAGRSSSNVLASARALVRLAGAWAWEEEAEKLLWDAASGGSDPFWALTLLRRCYEIGGDTRSLLRVFALEVKQNPEDLIARNNLAASSLLLGTNLVAAHQFAREVHVAEPANPSLASTYAYSLHLQGRTREGLDILAGFPENTFQETPGAAACYAVLLAAQGSKSEAEKHLAAARKGYLLPEERLLVDSVAKQLQNP